MLMGANDSTSSRAGSSNNCAACAACAATDASRWSWAGEEERAQIVAWAEELQGARGYTKRRRRSRTGACSVWWHAGVRVEAQADWMDDEGAEDEGAEDDWGEEGEREIQEAEDEGSEQEVEETETAGDGETP
ncbi:unnamed protein product [Polarella glacialis]|uniref:Uncharacterized protein n=1 Tax=Polarella glacialis TaxID=89957 RepID=A0A813HWS0_POLGL|nr:unnamed protein product [Polarella glacialis]